MLAPVGTNDKERLAISLLRSATFEIEREPNWVLGEVPDFFCSGPTDMWVEVKAIEELARHQAQARRAQWLSERSATLPLKGKAFAWVDEDCTERDIKAAIALARDLLDGSVDTSPQKHLFAIVPNDPDFSQRVKITATTKNGSDFIWAVRSKSGRYGRPQIGDEITTGEATIEDANGARVHVDAFDLGLALDDFAVALEIEQDSKPFRISAVALTGGAARLTTHDTVRRAAKKANDQFKNACRYRAAPCLLMVFEDGLLVNPDDKGLFKGIYMPLDLWKLLNASGRLKGRHGGNVLSYGNVGRRLNNSEFVTLVANSWVGTTIGQSAALEGVIRSVLESGKTVTFAVKRKLVLAGDEEAAT